MKIIIDYPVEVELKTTKVFTNLDDRTDWIQETIRRKKLNKSCNHHHTDFVVEFVRNIEDGKEYWCIGS